MKTILLLTLLAVGLASLAAAQDPSEALSLRFSPKGAARWTSGAERRARYEALMTALGRRPAPPDADPSPEAEVVRIARDRLARPAVYGELEAYYVKTWNHRAHVPAAWEARLEHRSESYRHAWEYLFLRPGDDTEAPGYGWSAAEALAKIHDDASLPLLVDGFERQSAHMDDSSFRNQAQTDAISNLSDFVSERGLDALLRCATVMKSSQTGAMPALRTDVAALVAERLAADHPRGRAEAWATVVETYRHNPAYRSRRAALDLILKDPNRTHP